MADHLQERICAATAESEAGRVQTLHSLLPAGRSMLRPDLEQLWGKWMQDLQFLPTAELLLIPDR